MRFSSSKLTTKACFLPGSDFIDIKKLFNLSLIALELDFSSKSNILNSCVINLQLKAMLLAVSVLSPVNTHTFIPVSMKLSSTSSTLSCS